MEIVCLIFTLFTGFAGGGAFFWEYVLSQKGNSVPLWLSRGKTVLFCGFFAGWFLWNLFRNLP